LLQQLSPLRRQRLHAQLAAAIEEHPDADRGRQVTALAHHLTAAVALVGPDAARVAAERAAAAAEDRLAFGEAAGWWRTAGDLVTAGPEQAERVHDLRVATGRALLLAGRLEDGRAVLRAAMDEALHRDEAVTAAEAGIALGASGGAWYWVDPGENPADLVQRLERTVAALRPSGHRSLVALLGTLALGIYYTEPARAAALVRDALQMARELGDPAVLAQGLLGAMAGEWGPGTTERHLALSEELIALPAAARHPAMEVACHLWRLTAHQERGELDAAAQQHEVAARTADRAGLQVLRAQVAIARVGQAWLGDGGLPAVEAAVDAAAELHRRSGLYAEQATPVANLCFVRLLQGRLEEVADELPALAVIGTWRREIEAMVQLAQGDPPGAAALLAAPRGRVPATWQWLPTKLARSLLLLECAAVVPATPDLSEQAGVLAEELLPHADVVGIAGMSMTAYGPVGVHVGALELLAGDLVDALTHLTAGVAACDRLGATIWATFGRLHLGVLRLRRGDADAAGLLQQAAADADRLGMAAVAARARRAAAPLVPRRHEGPDVTAVSS
jgi:hypothetical protein